jgi:hypothetical protein
VALGAQRSGVLWLVVKECALLVAAGLGMGIPLALASMRVIESQLFELSPMDPLTIALVSVVLAIVAAITGYVPARRAMRVDPMVVEIRILLHTSRIKADRPGLHDPGAWVASGCTFGRDLPAARCAPHQSDIFTVRI